MFRFAALVILVAGCSSDDSCGTLTLALGQDPGSYPTSANIGCNVVDGGVWNKVKNEAAMLFTSSDLPADVHITAVMPLDRVKAGVTFDVVTGIAGEAQTNFGGADRRNYATLTGGTMTVVTDRGTDDKQHARVFEVQWDLMWLGDGNYESHGKSLVWFSGVNGML